MNRFRFTMIIILMILFGLGLAVLLIFGADQLNVAEVSIGSETRVVTRTVITRTPVSVATPTPKVIELELVQRGSPVDFTTRGTIVPNWAVPFVDSEYIHYRRFQEFVGTSEERLGLTDFSVARVYFPAPINLSRLEGGRIVSLMEDRELEIDATCCVLAGEFLLIPNTPGGNMTLWLSMVYDGMLVFGEEVME